MESANRLFSQAIGDIILAIRRDMGNQKTRIAPDELFYQFDITIHKIGAEEVKPTQ